MKKETKNRGIIKIIIIIVIVLIILGYFGLDVAGVIESPTVQRNLQYVWGIVVNIWTNYLMAPFVFIWDKFFVGVLWKLIVAGLDKI